MRIIHRTFQAPQHSSTALQAAISKVMNNIPQSAPETTVKQTAEGTRFDVRFIPAMVWNKVLIDLKDMGAKEVEVTYLDDTGTWREKVK